MIIQSSKMVINLVLKLKRRRKSTYLQSKQGEPIPDSIATNCSSLYADLTQNKEKWLVTSAQLSCKRIRGGSVERKYRNVGEVGEKRRLLRRIVAQKNSTYLREKLIIIIIIIKLLLTSCKLNACYVNLKYYKSRKCAIKIIHCIHKSDIRHIKDHGYFKSAKIYKNPRGTKMS